ncbi:hypothetical protein EZV62_024616 [Acer yangbiense]|uniref:RNase H type-1 domain-containing protein n=1 Tax=Acer yangbiense TaxID=1000413 RepID=A0A5C7GVX4_9ROSI|nr:hypothetical protein EZV62_024616 [Acer yangbiense]
MNDAPISVKPRAVIRNHEGLVVLSGIKRLDVNSSLEIAKVHAVLFGIHLAIKAGILPICLETDAANVVKLVTSRGTSPNSEIAFILDEIWDCMQSNNLHANFSYVPRLANMVAHSLTKLARSFKGSTFDFVRRF